MSRWPRSFFGGGMMSPFGSRGEVPRVTDDDFSYITSEDLDKPERVYESNSHRHRGGPPQPDDDVIIAKHAGVVYPLKFPAYTIADGRLLVSDVRQRAAEVLEIDDPRRVKLLYKGVQLKDDEALARDYNLKNMSEVLCIVGDRRREEPSDNESVSTSSTSKSKKKKKSKKPSKKSGTPTSPTSPIHGTATHLTPEPTPTPRPATPSSADPNSPMGKLDAISAKLFGEFKPLCEAYIASPPTDQKKKDFEHKRLGEVLMREIMLKLDAVEVDGDDEVRQRRKNLVRETQNILSRLDQVAGTA